MMRATGRWWLLSSAVICLQVSAALAANGDHPRHEVSAVDKRAPVMAILRDAQSWGYQLQKLDPGAIPEAIDVMVVDYAPTGWGDRGLTAGQIVKLKSRKGAKPRLVLCYLSIGEAEDYRFYWQRAWDSAPPSWIGKQNPAWPGNYTVNYWDAAWQKLIIADDPAPQALLPWLGSFLWPVLPSYLDRILDSGFDGVYLDRVDAFETVSERPNAKADMIAFVDAIARHARARRPDFLIVPQNAEALLTNEAYRNVIDGIGKEDLLYGEKGDGVANADGDVDDTISSLNRVRKEGKPVFVVEYLPQGVGRAQAAKRIANLGYIPTFAPRQLDAPPADPASFRLQAP